MAAADNRQAGWINKNRPPEFQRLHQTLVDQLKQSRTFVAKVQNVHIRVAHMALKEQVRRGDRRELEQPAVSITQATPRLVMPMALSTSLDAMYSKYGYAVVASFLQWWPTTYDASQTVTWCSIIQLMVDYQKSTGNIGPGKTSENEWTLMIPGTPSGLVVATVQQRMQWFLQVVQSIWRAQGLTFDSGYVRPDSGAVRVWTRSVPWQWKPDRHRRVEEWLREHLPAGAVQRGGKGVGALPIARVDPEFKTLVAPNEHGLHRWLRSP